MFALALVFIVLVFILPVLIMQDVWSWLVQFVHSSDMIVMVVTFTFAGFLVFLDEWLRRKKAKKHGPQPSK
jgi:positive regulator of sigma E activity